MDKKYELTTETKTMPNGDVVYRIKALKSFKTEIDHDVKAGDLGGWVSSEDNLSHDGNCWLFDEAVNSGNSRRTGNSVGYNNAWGYENSTQFGNSRQYGNSRQFGDSQQSDNSQQFRYSRQYGNSRQLGNSRQCGESRQYGNSRQSDNSQQSGNSRQFGDSHQYGDSQQSGDSCQYGDSRQYDNSCQYGDSQQHGKSRQCGNSRHFTGVDSGNNEIITMGSFGDQGRYVTLQPDNSVCCGCFHGTFDEFVSAVERKYGPTGTYNMCIDILRVIIKERGNQSKETNHD